MNLKIKFYHRIIAMVLAFSFIFPIIPFEYIDLNFGTSLSKYNSFSNVAKAIEYDNQGAVVPFNHGYTGEVVSRTVTNLADIMTAIDDANNNPDDLYELTYNQSGAIQISTEVTLATSGHVRIIRGSANNAEYMFKVNNNGVLNIGSANMTGTIEIHGGASFTKDTSITYNFDNERKTTKNYKTNYNGGNYALFNDGEDYATAHWYKIDGLKSGYGLIQNNGGAIRLYNNARVGNVYCTFSGTSSSADGKMGAINNKKGTFDMYGGEISWNAMGIYNNGAGAALYVGQPGNNSGFVDGCVGTIYNGQIIYNVSLDVESNSADGGAIGVDRAKLVIRGGNISNNRNAITNADIRSAANGGAISGRVKAIIEMYGGTISNNFTGGLGGGISLWDADLVMYGGTITKNYALNGGGVATSAQNGRPCNVTLYNDATISENFAEIGGGISVGAEGGRGYYAKFIMLNGNIVNNTATRMGGGICNYNDKGSSLDLRGGNISNNNSPKGAGISITNNTSSSSPEYLLELSGGVSVNTNNDIYISNLNYTDSGNTRTYHIPINVKGRLNASGTIGMVSLDNYSQYVGTNNGKECILDLVKFIREDGGALEVQGNKFSIDTDEYILYEVIDKGTLRLGLSAGASQDIYVARIGDRLYTRLKSAIEDYAQNGDTIYIINNLTLTNTINVTKDIKIVPETTKTKNDSNILDKYLKDENGEYITPSGSSTLNFSYQPLGDYTISLASTFGDDSDNTAGFAIKQGGKLSLGDSQYAEEDITISTGGFLVLDGNSGHSINESFVVIESGGTLEANAGTSISNNAVNSNIEGAGVKVLSGGLFTLNGGTIKNNVSKSNGAGVYVIGNFRMDAGHIQENNAVNGGGVFVADGGNVIVNNGKLSKNTANENGAGLYVSNGGLVTINSLDTNQNTATLNGAGIYVAQDGVLTMNDGLIRNNRTVNGNGAGMYVAGKATLNGGTILDNTISTYNETPLGQGIYLMGELHVSDNIIVKQENPIYIVENNYIHLDDALKNSYSLPINTAIMEPKTIVAKIETENQDEAEKIETKSLTNKSIYEITENKQIKGKTENNAYYLIYDSIEVTYNANNGTTGDVPVDNEEYGGGDVVIPKENNANSNPVLRPGYVFLGWSTNLTAPITSAATELATSIYYPSPLIDGVIYKNSYTVFDDTTLYAVWAIDANRNEIPDYRENVLSLTIAESENGKLTSNLNEAQGGTLIMLTANPGDGYEVDTIEVRYTLNNVDSVFSLENGKVVKLTDVYYYFNMPLADATIYTTFKKQSIYEVRVTWNDGTEEDVGTLQEALNLMQTNIGTKDGKRVTLLKYIYTPIRIAIHEGLNFELDLAGYTLDTNHLGLTIDEGAMVKVTDSLSGGRISFDASGGSNGTPNNLVNNGTLTIAGGTIVMEEGDSATSKLIDNNGTLTVSGGSIKHNSNHGIAIYNSGVLNVTSGNINGKKYGIYHANASDGITFDISGLGSEATYGINLENYVSSIYLAKNTYINISNILGNCNSENVVANANKIDLYLDDEIGNFEPIIKSNRMSNMVRHFRMHFNLKERDNQEIVVDANNNAILITKPGSIITEAESPTYPYRTNTTLIATLYDQEGNNYVGATGKAYFFVFEQKQDWHNMWDPNAFEFRPKDPTDSNSEYYSLADAVGSADINSETGIAKCTFVNETLSLDKSYYIFTLLFGEGLYDTYSADGSDSYGYKGPIRVKNDDQGTFKITKKDLNDDSITINYTTEKNYNGQEQEVTIDVYDGERLLTLNDDYTVTKPSSLINAGTYTISIAGKGNYKGQVDKQFKILKYNEQITISGVALRYNFGTDLNLVFSGDNPTVFVKDNHDSTLEYINDYSVKFEQLDQSTNTYEEISGTPSAVGIYKLVATCVSGSTNYEEGLSAETAFIITDEGAQYDVTFENESLTYNGEERTISELGTITVKRRASEGVEAITLNESDFSAMFGVSNIKNAGTYPVIIQGEGNYSNVNIAENITIVPKTINSSNTTITYAESEYYYTGKNRIPEIVTFEIDGVNTDAQNGGTEIICDVDYVTSVQGDSINIGNPTFKITALNGNYTGSISYTYEIKPRTLTDNENVIISIYQTGFSGSEVKPVVTVIDKINGTSKILVDTVDYTVTYRAKESANDGALISDDGYPFNKGTYEAIIEGINNYTGSSFETFVIGNYRGKIVATLDPSVFTYAGNSSVLEGSIKKALTVTRGTDGEELEYGTDFVLGYNTPENRVAPREVGDYLLYIVGIGNYDEVQTTTTYTVSPLTGTIHLVLESDELPYNGQNQYPAINTNESFLSLNGIDVYLSALVENTDYAVIVNEDSKNVGGYTLQVNGIGRYAGNYNFANYQIVTKNLSDEDIQINSITPITKEYDGTAKTLTFGPSGDAWIEHRVDNTTTNILVEDTDFTVVYNNNTNAGTSVAVIVGKGNYSGVNSCIFTIEKRNIGNGTISAGYTLSGIEDKAYSGAACVQEFVLTDTSIAKTLVLSKDYEVTYENNINVGEASYTISGKGNYLGTITGTFNVLMNHTISIIANDTFEFIEEPVNDLITVKDSLNHILSQSEYELTYYKDSACTIKTSTQDGASGDGLVPAQSGTYYRKVVGKSINYNGLTATSEFTINEPQSTTVNMSISNTSYTYDGDVHSATIVLKDKDNNVLSSGDYEVTYYIDSDFNTKTSSSDGATINGGAPSESGMYYIKIVGLNKYSDFNSSSAFAINKLRINDLDIEQVNNVTYTGNNITPKPEVSWTKGTDRITLIENQDIVYEYQNNKDVGEASIIIKAKDGARNYEGQATITFNILSSLDLEARLENESVEYNGTIQKPLKSEILIGEKSIEQLELEGTIYTVDYGAGNYKDAGNYELIIRNQSSTNTTNEEKVLTYTITKKALIVTPKSGQTKVYGTQDTELKFTTNIATENGLYSGDSFEGKLSRAEGENVGEYVISEGNLNAKNYDITFTSDVKFNISAKDLADSDITLSGVEESYTYNGNNIIPNVSITYTSSNGNIALTSGTDFEISSFEKYDEEAEEYVLTTDTKQVGKYRMNVSGKGNYTGTKSQVFEVETIKAFNASFSNTSKVYNRNPQDPTVRVNGVSGTLTLNQDYIYVYYTDSSYFEKTDTNCGATYEGGAPVNVGSYYLRVEGIGNYLGCIAESEFRIVPKNIQDKTSGTDYEISITDILDQIYTGNEIKPTTNVSWNGVSLNSSSDYEMTYSANINAGVAHYRITGKGNYEGVREGIFNIVANASGEIIVTLKDSSNHIVDETTSSYIYDGTEHKPSVEVKIALEESEAALVENQDYILSYKDDVNAGLGTVTILLTGNYAGSIEKQYLISQRNIDEVTIVISPDNVCYNGHEQKPNVLITYNEVVLSSSSDYVIDYGTGNYVDADEYDITISSTLNGNFTGSIEETFEITPYGTCDYESFNIEFNNDKSSYSDTEFSETLLRNNIIVKDMDGNIVPNTNYTLSFKKESDASFGNSASSDVAHYLVKATGNQNSNYSGIYATGVRGYVIYTNSLSADPIEIIYDGLTHTISNSDLVVKSAGGQVLSQTDYEVSFGDVEVKDSGTYTIYITGKNDFENATGSCSYKIKPATFSVDEVESKTYNGISEQPTIIVKGINNSNIIQGKDYEVSYVGTTLAGSHYESNKTPSDAGNYTITVAGRRNYAGTTKSVDYTILPKSLSDDEIEVNISNNDLQYNGVSRQASISAMYNLDLYSIKLHGDVDYEITSNTEYTNAGTYTIRITAKTGNYSDYKDVDFNISPYTGKLQVTMTTTTFNYGTTLEQIEDELSVKYSNELFTSDMYDVTIYPSTTSVPAVGNYTMTIAAKGTNYTDGEEKANAEIKFRIIPANQTQIAIASGDTVVYNGKVQKPTLNDLIVGEKSIADWIADGKDCTVDYGDGNYKDVGVYLISSAYKEGGILIEESSGTFKIIAAPVTVTPLSDQFKYYGEEDDIIEFTTNITSGNNGLYEDDVFTSHLVRTQGENVGNYEIKQDGLTAPNYEITLTPNVTYEIKAKDISTQGITVTGINDSYSYSGSAIKPTAIITYDSDKFGKLALAENNDFRIKYQVYDEDTDTYIDSTSDEELVDVGRYKAIVTGINNYTGNYEKEYEITGYVTSFVAVVSDNNKTYNKQIQRALVQVTGTSNLLEEGRDYRVVYYTNNSYTIKTNTSYGLGGANEEGGAPRNAGTYYIEVEGIGNYTGSSSRATFVINPKPISDAEIQFTEIVDQTYTGSDIEPQVILTWGVGLVEGTDYNISYSNNKNVGTAGISINGIGNYCDSRKENFEIIPISEGLIELELSNTEYVYDGQSKEPTVTVKYTIDNETHVLTSGDYDVSYSNNVNRGTAVVTVNLKDKYSGSKEETFDILPYDLSNAEISITPTNNTYNGKNQDVNVSVTALNTLLVKGTDYTINIPSEMKNAKEYTISVNAILESNYTGTTSGEYTINKYGIEDEDTLMLDFVDGKSSYKEGITKTSFEEKLIVKDLNRNTLSADDYVVTYSSDGNTYNSTFPTSAGTYKVRVVGKGTNYAGRNDVAIREFGIFVESVTVSNINASYKNAEFTINDIIDQISIKSDLNTPISGDKFNISFGSSNPKDVGVYTVIATGKSNSEYSGLTGMASFEIKPVDITFSSISDVNYSGKSTTPTMTISGVDGADVVLGKDYTLNYSGQDSSGATYNSTIAPTNVGTYTVTVNGTGNYTGTVTKEYRVKATNISSSEIIVEIQNNNAVYNTDIQRPTFNVTYETVDGIIRLSEGIDYTIEHNSNVYKNAKDYTVRIKAINTSNYVGYKDVTYTIKPYTGTLDVALANSPYPNGVTLDDILDDLTVSYKNDTLNLDDLDISCSIDELTTGSITLEIKVKNGVRNYYYSEEKQASGYVVFMIEDLDRITISIEDNSVVYTAEEIEITKDDVIVDNDKTVSELENENDDYEYLLEISDTIIDVGEYTITLKVRKDDTLLQQASTKFTVIQKDISDIDSNTIEAQVYTGSNIEPEVTLTYNGETLDSGDCTIIYSNNKDVGEATITIIGKGNYKGTKTINFSIVSDPSDVTIELYENGARVDDETYVFDGTAKTPEVKVLKGSKVLNNGSDYTVSYLNNVNAGNATARVTLKGNYSGTEDVNFKINKFDLSDTMVTLSEDATYNGKEQKPIVTVTNNNVLLIENTDYTINFDDGFINAGTYTVEVLAKAGSNYKGSVENTFKIKQYGKNENEILLVEFEDGKSSYKENTSKEEFEQNIIVKDIYGNILGTGDYVITYSGDSSEFPTDAGIYEANVVGNGTNYAGDNDKCTREFAIYIEEIILNDIEKSYKNEEYTIDEILDEITIKSNLDTDLSVDDFDISFGKTAPKNVGSYTIIASGKQGTSMEGLLGTAEFVIDSIDTFEVDDIDDIDYTGNSTKPEIIVKDEDDTELAENKDYTITYAGTDSDGNHYEGNVPPAKAGDYQATITGIGNYQGASATRSFSIKEIEDDDITADLSQTEFIYNETNQVPVEIVRYETNNYTILLVKDTDYEVSYEDSNGYDIAKDDIIDADDYKAVIRLMGNYSGTIELDFSIVEPESDAISVSIKDNSKVFNNEPQEIEVIVKDANGNELQSGTDYKITYYTDTSFTTKTSEDDGAESEGGAPKNSGKYYVQIEGLGDYEDLSSDTTFIISKKSIDDLTISEIDNQIYTGEEIEPEVTVKDGEITLSSNDYTITYSNNTEMGTNTASLTVKMKNDSNYQGSKTVYFSIISNPDSDTEIELKDENGNDISDSSYTYDKTDKKPTVVVKHDGKTLVEGKDYTVTYSNNRNAGTATAKVTLKGNYQGTATKQFKINPLEISNADVTIKPNISIYNGSNIKPTVTSVTVETEDGKLVKLGSNDFEVVYPESSIKAGKYTLTVNAISNNYTGSATGSFEIVKKSSDSTGGGGGSTGTKSENTKQEPEETKDTSILEKEKHISYISGYDDRTFKPDNSITRAEIVTIFTRLLKEKPKTNGVDNRFYDIEDHWAKEYILIMSSLGIVRGYEDGSFKPENKITRAEFATMISRFEEIKKVEIKSTFIDVPSDHWAYNTINYARLMGWISGYEDGTFKPNNSITRAEAITIINRMLGRIGDINKINSNNALNHFTDIDGHWAFYGIIEATIPHDYEFDNDLEIWK